MVYSEGRKWGEGSRGQGRATMRMLISPVESRAIISIPCAVKTAQQEEYMLLFQRT